MPGFRFNTEADLSDNEQMANGKAREQGTGTRRKGRISPASRPDCPKDSSQEDHTVLGSGVEGQDPSSQIMLTFDFKGSALRTIMRGGENWYVATDLCAVLDQPNPRQAISRLEDDEKDILTVDTSGGAQEVNIVSESGMFALVLTSRKPEAKVFRRWIPASLYHHYDGRARIGLMAPSSKHPSADRMSSSQGRVATLSMPDPAMTSGFTRPNTAKSERI